MLFYPAEINSTDLPILQNIVRWCKCKSMITLGNKVRWIFVICFAFDLVKKRTEMH